MKSVLLYAHGDNGQELRLQASLEIVRALRGHLTCAHATPMTSYVAMDVAGGTFVMPEVLDALREDEVRDRQAFESRLAQEEDVPWTWIAHDGDAVHVLMDASQLADLIVVSISLAGDRSTDMPAPLAGPLALEVRCPVLAVPPALNRFDLSGSAVVAWDGSPEVCRAIRAAVPLLARAGQVHIVTVEEPKGDVPASDAAAYLSCHGIGADAQLRSRKGRSVEESLHFAVAELGASWMVMGAYGHNRLRELVFGGVTKHMLSEAQVPVLLAH